MRAKFQFQDERVDSSVEFKAPCMGCAAQSEVAHDSYILSHLIHATHRICSSNCDLGAATDFNAARCGLTIGVSGSLRHLIARTHMRASRRRCGPPQRTFVLPVGSSIRQVSASASLEIWSGIRSRTHCSERSERAVELRFARIRALAAKQRVLRWLSLRPCRRHR